MVELLAAWLFFWVLGWLSLLIISALIGCYISGEKGRGGTEGLVFGFLLGPIGVLVTVLMPAPDRPVNPGSHRGR